MKKHLSLSVNGRVQGVFFRAETQKKAQELGLTGTVKNEPDGSVTIEVEGDDSALEAFLAWVHQGPSAAQVQTVEMEEGKMQDYSDFAILYE